MIVTPIHQKTQLTVTPIGSGFGSGLQVIPIDSAKFFPGQDGMGAAIADKPMASAMDRPTVAASRATSPPSPLAPLAARPPGVPFRVFN